MQSVFGCGRVEDMIEYLYRVEVLHQKGFRDCEILFLLSDAVLRGGITL